MRSLLGYLSPYVRSLEIQVDELKDERKRLVDRIVRLTTGFELSEDVPNAVEEQNLAIDLEKKKREAIRGIPAGPARPHEVLARAEAMSFQREAAELNLQRELAENVEESPDSQVSPEYRVLQQGVR